jgi:hypothetical protein
VENDLVKVLLLRSIFIIKKDTKKNNFRKQGTSSSARHQEKAIKKISAPRAS